MQGIEPTSCLVHSLSDEVGGASELVGTEVTQPLLGIRHGSGVEPDVDQVRLPCHLLSRRTDKEYVVHIRPVEIDLVIVGLAHILRIEALVLQRVGGHETGLYGFLDLSI